LRTGVLNRGGLAVAPDLLKRMDPGHKGDEMQHILRDRAKLHEGLMSLLAAVRVALRERGQEL
jgi:dienelactone hydrolase